VAIGFADFNSLVVEDAGSGGLAAPTALSHDATGSYTFSYSGTISVDFTPNSDCEVEGTFTFVTDTPIHQGLGDSCPVAGQFTINGNTTIVYNSDGSVDVTLEGSDPVHFDTCDEVTGLCDVQDLEASGGEAAGDDGTSVSGDGFLVTASWKDDTFDQSDMDLHVGYYGDSSPSSGPADALVSWHSSGTGCEDDHTPIAFGTAFALLDFDDCDGIGPEHVTMDGLSAGYYVIAVNSYALHGSFSAEVNVGVTIGETVYTFDPHTFTTEDFDGTDSDAWYRVVDLKCPTEGICTFESPDLTLQVHDQAGIDGGYLFKTKKK
jgi:hypothetical protein